MIRIANDAGCFRGDKMLPGDRLGSGEHVLVRHEEDTFAYYLADLDFSGDGEVDSFMYCADSDPGTALEYNHTRWYDPTTGAWLSTDGAGQSDASLYGHIPYVCDAK